MDAPWPYTDEPFAKEQREPTWDCPEGVCVCHDCGDDEPFQFSIMLYDRLGRRMGNARFRAVNAGRVVNEDLPYADAHGWANVLVRHQPQWIHLEWAPEHVPLEPGLPYRLRYYVDLAAHDPDEALQRRLHNLGYSAARAATSTEPTRSHSSPSALLPV